MKPSIEHQLAGALASAVRRFDVGDADHAISQAADIIRHHPEHVPARLLLARAMLQVNRPTEALDQLNAADQYFRGEPQHQPDDLQARHVILRARALARLDRHDEARAALQRLLDEQPDHERALLMLAEWELESGDVLGAIEHLDRLLRLRPNDPSALRLLGEACDQAGDASGALAIIDRLDHAPPSSLRRARLLSRAGQLTDAWHELRTLADDHPLDADLSREAAEMAIELGEDAHACRWLSQAADADRDMTGDCMLALAHQHMRSGRFGRAARCCRRVMRSAGAGQREHAIAALMVCACVEGRDRLIDRCGRLLQQAVGRADERRAIIARAWTHAVPGLLLTHLIESRQEAETTDPLWALLDEAVESLDEATTKHPDHADRHYHLAVAHAALEQDDAAVVALDRALAINRRYGAAAQLRAELLEKAGHDTAAQAVLDSAERYNEAA